MQFENAGKFILNKLSKELPKRLSYHSVEHILDVCDAAKLIGEQEKISDEEMKLLLTAAWYHDSGFLKGAKDHEEESCRIAKENLPRFDYPPEKIERICGMIMATKIPQSPKNHLEEILADADLDYLGRDDFFSIGDKLFNELSIFGFISTEDEWNRLQVRFLESHHYFTETAIKLRKNKKEEHLALVKSKIR
ncbi:HD domain-containing protein [Mucilaginibacter arboris]|uniref:HD domain-containing protein n=1 Tax=Mucilaginibacter arboris TaxID=2682090 RepID=A0A7K1SYM1_9SPHI|nr:HD domain-containing protein [Mucilaginibacter arboris]MVN22424.1 HD domain-containing protein [Mucilaginibacter arboris]